MLVAAIWLELCTSYKCRLSPLPPPSSSLSAATSRIVWPGSSLHKMSLSWNTGHQHKYCCCLSGSWIHILPLLKLLKFLCVPSTDVERDKNKNHVKPMDSLRQFTDSNKTHSIETNSDATVFAGRARMVNRYYHFTKTDEVWGGVSACQR